jgi:hypothetical protein
VPLNCLGLLDSLAATEYSRRRWILSVPLDSLAALPGCTHWMLSAPPDSLVAQFPCARCLLSAPLNSLGPSGFPRCLWILSLLTQLGSLDSLVPHVYRMCSQCILSFDGDSIIPTECCCRMLLCRFVYLVDNPSSVFHHVRCNVAFVDRREYII